MFPFGSQFCKDFMGIGSYWVLGRFPKCFPLKANFVRIYEYR
jgi:hypothetical protein